MPKRKVVNFEKLLKAVESGKTSKEIMDTFGIKTSAQLKSMYLDALVSKGKAKGIPGRGGKSGAGPKSKAIMVNKRGSLVISKELVSEMGFNIEDAFTVRKTKSGISLKKA
ncbi:MAG: hypothetical protein AB1896_02720 [Thermodesulfobacteriota bacterium]